MIVMYVVYTHQIILKLGQLQAINSTAATPIGLDRTGRAYELAKKDAEDEKLLQNLDLR